MLDDVGFSLNLRKIFHPTIASFEQALRVRVTVGARARIRVWLKPSILFREGLAPRSWNGSSNRREQNVAI